MSSSARVLVVGLGGLGGVVAGALAEAGVDVTAWARRAEVRHLVRSRGLRLEDRRGARTVGLPVVDVLPEGAFDHALLAVPPDGVEAAARVALPSLARAGTLVPLANGLPEELLVRAVAPAAVIGAVVDLRASAPAAGTARRSSRGAIVIGRPAGEPDAAALRLAALLAHVAPVRVTANLRGARWAKLALNASLSAMVAAAGVPFGPLLRRAPLRHLALQVLGEVRAVAHAEGVALEGGGLCADRLGFAPGAVPAWPGRIRAHLGLLAVGFPYRASRSSLLAQLERGVVPPVAYLNGEVVRRGRAHRIPVPANEALLEGILAIARGEARSSLATLAAVARRARSGEARRG